MKKGVTASATNLLKLTAQPDHCGVRLHQKVGTRRMGVSEGRMDINTNAFRVVQEATGQGPTKSSAKSQAGKKGGMARAKTLSSSQKREIAVKANRARWESNT